MTLSYDRLSLKLAILLKIDIHAVKL